MTRCTIIYFILLFSVRSFFAQSIYAGGTGDGLAINCYQQVSNSALSIYYGGNSDGGFNTCYQQGTNIALNIYYGGNSDGASNSCYQQSSNIAFDIYNGGNADGFSTLCYVQNDNPSMNIYYGGIADGFSTLCYVQNDNPSMKIYSGGNADGFSTLCYLQSDNLLLNIYKGGVQDGYGVGCLGTQANPVPLPIELVSFTGKCENNTVIIKWSTATEHNNDFFSLERSSDAFNWQVVGKVNGAGNSLTQKYYSFSDLNPLGSVTYYRLKQTDFNKSYNYSGILYVENCGRNISGLIIYPNPNNGSFTLRSNIPMNLSISDELGRTLKQVVLNEANNNQSVVSGLSDGIYIITGLNDGVLTKQKIVVAK